MMEQREEAMKLLNQIHQSVRSLFHKQHYITHDTHILHHGQNMCVQFYSFVRIVCNDCHHTPRMLAVMMSNGRSETRFSFSLMVQIQLGTCRDVFFCFFCSVVVHKLNLRIRHQSVRLSEPTTVSEIELIFDLDTNNGHGDYMGFMVARADV